MKFLQALKNRREEGGVPLIPDIKCFSPKDGDLLRGRDPILLAKELEAAGACALSVVTEEKEFHGSMELLREVCQAVSVPVLRKDFITSEQDLDETRNAGADAILLMVSCLGEEALTRLYHAARERGLTPFVETHTWEELAFARKLKAPLVGINNRNIQVLERDDGTVQHAADLLGSLHGPENRDRTSDCFVVVESALRDGADVRKALRSGADGVLVGTAILMAPNPALQYQRMTRHCGLKICGLMSKADVDICLQQGVDICGFVTEYPVDVRWNLSAEQAEELLSYVKSGGVSGPIIDVPDIRVGEQADFIGEPLRAVPDPSVKTCVVTGGTPEQVMALADRLKPDYIQLHYRETLGETRQIAKELKKQGICVIRSVPVDDQARIAMFGTDDLSSILDQLVETEVAAILLDSREAGNASSGGGSLMDALSRNHEMADLKSHLSGTDKWLLIGGGITPVNAAAAAEQLQPDFLDVMTGAEDAEGRKSAERIQKLSV